MNNNITDIADVKTADLERLELIIYIVGGVTLLLLFILFIIVGYLLKQVRKLKQNDAYIDKIEDIRPSSLNRAFTLPKPNFSRNWHTDEENRDSTFHFSDGKLNQSEFGAKRTRNHFDETARSMPTRNHENEFHFGGNRPKKADIAEFGGNRLNQIEGGRWPKSNEHFGGGNITKNASNLHGAFRNPLVIAPDYDEDKNFSLGSNRDTRPNNAYY